MAQDLLWEYAQRRRAVDHEFASDLEEALTIKGYVPPKRAAKPEPITRRRRGDGHAFVPSVVPNMRGTLIAIAHLTNTGHVIIERRRGGWWARSRTARFGTGEVFLGSVK